MFKHNAKSLRSVGVHGPPSEEHFQRVNMNQSAPQTAQAAWREVYLISKAAQFRSSLKPQKKAEIAETATDLGLPTNGMLRHELVDAVVEEKIRLLTQTMQHETA